MEEDEVTRPGVEAIASIYRCISHQFMDSCPLAFGNAVYRKLLNDVHPSFQHISDAKSQEHFR